MLWLDASTLGGNDGTLIGTWPDLSGQTNDMLQATGSKQPSLYTNQVNEQAVVRFDGTADTLASSTTDIIGDGSAYTKFVVVSFDTINQAGNTVASRPGNARSRLCVLLAPCTRTVPIGGASGAKSRRR